jgi:ABC-type branched-subunit amino acid transport system substrate-binding protein
MKSKKLLRMLGYGFFILVSLNLLFIGGYISEVKAAPEEKPIKIFSPVGLTGPWSYCMKPQLLGYQTYFKYVNEVEKGIDGHPIELVWADSSYDPTKTMSLYKRWKSEGTVALLILTGSPDGEATKATLARDKVVGIDLYCSDPMFYPPAYTYGVGTTYHEMHMVWLRHIAKTWNRPEKPVLATYYPEFPWAFEFDKLFKEAAQRFGITYAGLELAKPGAPSLKSELERLMAKGVNQLMTILPTGLVKILFSSMDEMGIRKKMDVGLWGGIYLEEIGRIVGPSFEGITGIGWYPVEEDALTKPRIKKIKEYWDKTTSGEKFESPQMSGWMMGEIAVQAIRQTIKKVGYDNLNGENLKKYGFDAIKDWEGDVHPKTTITSANQTTARLNRVYRYKDGKLHVAEDWTPRPELTRDLSTGAVDWTKYFASPDWAKFSKASNPVEKYAKP